MPTHIACKSDSAENPNAIVILLKMILSCRSYAKQIYFRQTDFSLVRSTIKKYTNPGSVEMTRTSSVISIPPAGCFALNEFHSGREIRWVVAILLNINLCCRSFAKADLLPANRFLPRSETNKMIYQPWLGRNDENPSRHSFTTTSPVKPCV